MRWAAYAGTSAVLAIGVILRAFHERPNFYSAAVYLSQSNACLMILANVLLLGVAIFMFCLQRLLYGPLRPIEIEQLYEKAWFAVTETCLAMTIFREEVGGWFLVMFVGLLVGKVWGWIGEGRVEVLEQQPPANPRLFHARLSFSLFISLVYDFSLLNYTVSTVLQQAKPDMMVMFAFEFAVLCICSLSTASRYTLSLTEAAIIKRQTKLRLEERRAELRLAREEALRRAAEPQEPTSEQGNATAEPPADLPDPDTVGEIDIDVPGWEDKGQWIFYLELATDFIKLMIYISFFFILLTFYGLPIHIMRDVFLTLRSFIKRIRDFLRYRRATRDMNERYPDATAEEVGRGEVCIICREEMRAWQGNDAPAVDGQDNVRRGPSTMDERSRPKKLPCGHILHFGCLRSWLERQQICPTCRRPVLVPNRAQLPHPQAAQNQRGIEGGDQNVPPQQQHQQPHAQLPPPQHRHPHHPGGQGAQADPAPGADQPQMRGRFVNLGPFRIGFGVGRGNLFQDMAQQLQGGQPQPALAQNEGHPGHAHDALRGVAVGFGLGRPHDPMRNHAHAQQNLVNAQFAPTVHDSWQVQLLQMEIQMGEELRRLHVQADQLRVIHALRAELARLRQEAATGTRANLSPTIPFQPHAPVRGVQVVQTHASNPNAQSIPAGDPNLPPGVIIPPGWTVLPLNRVPRENVSSNRSSGTPVVPSVPVPDSSATSRGPSSTTPTQTEAGNNLASTAGSLPFPVPNLSHSGSGPSSSTADQTEASDEPNSTLELPPVPIPNWSTPGSAASSSRPMQAQASDNLASGVSREQTGVSTNQSQQSIRNALSSLDNSFAVLNSIAADIAMRRANGSDTSLPLSPRANGLSPNWDATTNGSPAQRDLETRSEHLASDTPSAKGKDKAVEPSQSDGPAASSSTSAEGSMDKGKGRAVTIEDVAEDLD